MYKNYKFLLNSFVKFKSISTDPKFILEIKDTVSWLEKLFNHHGFEVKVIQGYGNPLVLASVVVNKNLPTALIYGHYDVQPAEIGDGWSSEPFELNVTNGRLVARGATDNKGQVTIHISTIFDLIKKRKLAYNIKFLLEGDEESGSEHIEEFFKDHKGKLGADFVLISDGELSGVHPCLDTSFRGIVNASLSITTSEKDNHSGLYGGSIPNAANELARLLAKMHDKDGNLTIKGINNKSTFNKSIMKNNQGIPYSQKEFLRVTGAKNRFNTNLDFYTQTGFLTSAEITTLDSGYKGKGYKNAIPGRAIAKINFRLAPDVSVKMLSKSFKDFLTENLPSYLNWKLDLDQSSEGFFIDVENEVSVRAANLLEKSFKTKVYNRPCGAIVPIADLFIKHLKVPLVMAGLANEDCNMHGANENIEISVVKKGLKFSRMFFSD